MQDRMTVTDIARHLDISRPSAYRVVEGHGFPARGNDKRWDRAAVLDWLARNNAAGVTVLGGVLVKTVA